MRMDRCAFLVELPEAWFVRRERRSAEVKVKVRVRGWMKQYDGEGKFQTYVGTPTVLTRQIHQLMVTITLLRPGHTPAAKQHTMSRCELTHSVTREVSRDVTRELTQHARSHTRSHDARSPVVLIAVLLLASSELRHEDIPHLVPRVRLQVGLHRADLRQHPLQL